MTHATIPKVCIDRHFSERRSSTFRKDRNSKAGTIGNVEKRMGKASSSSIPILTPTHLASGNGTNWKLGHTTPKMDVDTRLGDKEVSTNVLLKKEAD